MRTILSFCLFLFLAVTVAGAATPQMSLQNGTIVAKVKGKERKLPAEEYPLADVANADLRYTLVGEEQSKTTGLDEGVYLFNPAGKPAGFVPLSDASNLCSALSMSPGGTVLAVDFGAAMVRDWNFYSWPALKKLSKEPGIYFLLEDQSGPIWVNDKAVLFAAMNTESGRQCQYDPCGSLSVALYTIADSKTTTVLQGTDLCDYTPISISNGTITAEKFCLPSVDAWKNYPEDRAQAKTITAPLP